MLLWWSVRPLPFLFLPKGFVVGLLLFRGERERLRAPGWTLGSTGGSCDRILGPNWRCGDRMKVVEFVARLTGGQKPAVRPCGVVEL